MRSLSLICISALALAGACSSKPANAPTPAAPVAPVTPVTPVTPATPITPDDAQEANIGGCTYMRIAGTCELTAIGDVPRMTFKGTLDGAAVTLADNAVRQPELFKPLAVGTSTACTIDFETKGTCTPCGFSVGECGKAAWDAFAAHK